MGSLLESVFKQLGGDNLQKISGQLGADENSTRNAVSTALPLLINALSRNSSSSDGANALSGALDRDHDGGIMDNLSEFLGNPDTASGEGILNHVLGARRGQVEKGLSKSSGLDTGSVGKLMGMLAPVLMGTLGKVKRDTGMDSQSLAGYLGEEKTSMEKSQPQMGILGKLLDSDNDGDVDLGDVVKLARKFFN